MSRCCASRFGFFAFLVLLSHGLSSCGTAESELEKAARRGLPFVVGFSGNATCAAGDDDFPGPGRTGIYRGTKAVIERIRESRGGDVDIPFVASCYNRGASWMSYVSSWNGQGHYRVGEPYLRDRIIRDLQRHGFEKAIIIGHSYGGWLALDMAARLGEEQGVAAMVSLDPISKNLCTVATPQGCRQAPEDVDQSMRESIVERTGTWLNYWQDETWYLHSSPIEEATENIKLPLSHTEIDRDQRVWARVEDLIESQF